jgi:integrase/recombinase XerD
MDAYLHAAGLTELKKSPLFRSARGRTGELTENGIHRVDVFRISQRRARDTGLNADICCHTFRATGITAYLANGGTLKTRKPWPLTRGPARRNSKIERTMKSRSMKLRRL